MDDGSTVMAWSATGMIQGTTTDAGAAFVGSRVGAALSPPKQNSQRLPGSNGGSRHRIVAHAAGSNEAAAVGR